VNRIRRFIKERTGAVSVTVALTIVMLVGFGAMAVDLGHFMVTRAQLQNAADACALAAANKLLADAGQHDASLSISDALSMAVTVAQDNVAAKKNLTLNGSDVELGVWNQQNRTFTVVSGATSADEVNAVRVTVRRDGTSNGPISTFLANIFGMSSMNVQATAVAYLGWAGSAGSGVIAAPIYIEETALGPGDYVFQNVDTSWSAEGVSFFAVSGDNYMDFQYYMNGNKPVPSIKVGDYVYQVNEYSSSWIQSIYSSWFRNRYNANKDANGVWTVLMPVVGDPGTARGPGIWKALAWLLTPSTAQACEIRWNVRKRVKGYVPVDIISFDTNWRSPHRYSVTFRLSTEAKVFPKTITGGPSFGSGARAAIARLVQ
jgi:Flp pilus assembly protein TadG